MNVKIQKIEVNGKVCLHIPDDCWVCPKCNVGYDGGQGLCDDDLGGVGTALDHVWRYDADLVCYGCDWRGSAGALYDKQTGAYEPNATVDLFDTTDDREMPTAEQQLQRERHRDSSDRWFGSVCQYIGNALWRGGTIKQIDTEVERDDTDEPTGVRRIIITLRDPPGGERP